MTRDEPPRSGILNIDKPPGWTSHDVVKAVRRAAGVRRVGHAGTLDPLATGVLVVCMGSATRVIEDIQAGTKTYQARARLGIATTTYDAEGEVTSEHDASGVTLDEVEAHLDDLRGEILQRPPMYSAVRHEGKRLYELAREGIEVERQPRPVTVYELTLTEFEPPDLALEMRVSKGTYVRSIIHDLGQALGVGAHLTALKRTAVGNFTIDEAETVERVAAAFDDGWWPNITFPLDTALLHLPALIVDEDAEAAIRNGRQIDGRPPPGPDGARVRCYSTDGRFIALMRWDGVSGRWQPDRVFPKV